MGQYVFISIVDDLDASPADETVPFSLDGLQYEIDLSVVNAAELRRLVASYSAVARLREPRGAVEAQRRSAAERRRTSAIRRWARTQGLHVTSRGRLPDQVIDRYLHRHEA
ncbi:MAG: Lsr2 family protein [Acidimicrobiia bacterium]